jgi:hypothetical protein
MTALGSSSNSDSSAQIHWALRFEYGDAAVGYSAEVGSEL